MILGAIYVFVFMMHTNPTLNQNTLSENDTMQRKTEIRNIFDKIGTNARNGDMTSVTAEYEQLLQRSDLTEQEILNIKLDYALALSAQGNDGVEKAYGVLREVLESPTATAFTQASALNAGLSIYSSDLDSRKLNLLLNSTFFKEKNVPDADDGLKFRKIAEIGNSLYPTSIGTIREAFWYGQQLLNQPKLSPELKKAYSQKIIFALEESKTISKKQKIDSIQHYNTEVWKYTENAYRAYLLGMLAISDNAYVDEMRSEYQTLFAIDSKNEANIPLMQASVYSYFYYAAMLNQINAVLYKDDIDGSIVQLLARVRTLEIKFDSNSDALSFGQFIRQVSSLSKENNSTNYKYFISLAKYSESFKNLLQKYGWIF